MFSVAVVAAPEPDADADADADPAIEQIEEEDRMRALRFFMNRMTGEENSPEDLFQERLFESYSLKQLVPDELASLNRQMEIIAMPVLDSSNAISIDIHEKLADGQYPVRDPNTWYEIKPHRIRYKGEWKDGKPHGQGIKELLEGPHRTYEGRPCDASGNLRFYSCIVGNFVKGYSDGYGIQYYQQTEPEEISVPHYKGFFHDGLHHGMGEYHFGTGEFYKGSFRNSLLHGRAILYKHQNRRTTIGVYVNDVRVQSVIV